MAAPTCSDSVNTARLNTELQPVAANIHDERSIVDALAGAYGVINAVGLYVERRPEPVAVYASLPNG
jgi:uncharacterized protein YbjT (DUF2867 family)